MRTIGIRAAPDVVTFAVYDVAKKELLNVESINVPKALNRPEALKYIRNNFLDVLHEYKIERAGLRVTESNSQHLNIDRIEIEGVIQECFASSSLKSYYCGQISSISAKIGIERAQFKPLVSGAAMFDRVENWQNLAKEEREAVLAALGAEHA